MGSFRQPTQTPPASTEDPSFRRSQREDLRSPENEHSDDEEQLATPQSSELWPALETTDDRGNSVITPSEMRSSVVLEDLVEEESGDLEGSTQREGDDP